MLWVLKEETNSDNEISHKWLSQYLRIILQQCLWNTTYSYKTIHSTGDQESTNTKMLHSNTDVYKKQLQLQGNPAIDKTIL